MEYLLRITELAERALFVMLEDNDGSLRLYYQLTPGGAGQARRVLADPAGTRAKPCSSLASAQPGVLGVPL